MNYKKNLFLLLLKLDKFLNIAKNTNQDDKDIIDMYKDNENGFTYSDPLYLDSYNAYYNSYENKQTD